MYTSQKIVAQVKRLAHCNLTILDIYTMESREYFNAAVHMALNGSHDSSEWFFYVAAKTAKEPEDQRIAMNYLKAVARNNVRSN